MSFQGIKTFFSEKIYLTLGLLCLLCLVVFFVLSIPIYIYRVLIVAVAKLFNSDLDGILGGLSAMFASDLMTNEISRSNVVVATVVRGRLNLQELKEEILHKWIMTSSVRYKKFHQYPVQWMGFLFWKNAKSAFNINNHVHLLSSSDAQIKPAQLQQFMENLLNTNLPLDQSPWQLYLIENYCSSTEIQDAPKFANQVDTPSSALILKWHHCLSDGIAIQNAFLECFSDSEARPTLVTPKTSRLTFSHILWYALTLPVNLLMDLPSVLSYFFRSSPYKLTNNNKKGHQIYVSSKPVHLEKIKEIKNTYNVSFTSVLMSGISFALNKDLVNAIDVRTAPHCGMCVSVLPIPGLNRPKQLTNHMTGLLLNLPVSEHSLKPVQRLKLVHQMLKKLHETVFPVEFFIGSTLFGWHLFHVSKYFANQKLFPIILTNFASMQETTRYKNRETIQIHAAPGALQGIAGINIAIVGHNQEMYVHLVVEASLMSREQANKFVNNILDEIEILSAGILKKSL